MAAAAGWLTRRSIQRNRGRPGERRVTSANGADRHLEVAPLGEVGEHGVIGGGAVEGVEREAAAGVATAAIDAVDEGGVVDVAGAGRRAEEAAGGDHRGAQAV